ncbi:hypothetical protein NKG05_14060 [Oerskovia sp. M15]
MVHEEVAPGITAVAEAATYELPDKTVVLDTGIETGEHGDRFLIVSTVELVAGVADEESITNDPGTGVVVPIRDPKDPAYIQEMAALGYLPIENQRVQVVVGDEDELNRIRSGAAPTTVVVPEVGSTVTVETGMSGTSSGRREARAMMETQTPTSRRGTRSRARTGRWTRRFSCRRSG